MHDARLDDQLQTFGRLRLTWRLLRDQRVSGWMKALLPVIAAAYLLLPIDLIPDVILGFGQVDDVSVMGILLFAMTRLLPRFAPQEVVAEHLAAMDGRKRQASEPQGDVIDAEFVELGDRQRRHDRASQPDRSYER